MALLSNLLFVPAARVQEMAVDPPEEGTTLTLPAIGPSLPQPIRLASPIFRVADDSAAFLVEGEEGAAWSAAVARIDAMHRALPDGPPGSLPAVELADLSWSARPQGEDARAMQVPIDGADAASLRETVLLMRILTATRVPILIRVPWEAAHPGCRRAIAAGADAVHIDARGADARRIEAAMTDLARAHEDMRGAEKKVARLVTIDRRDVDPLDVAILLALGADAVGIADDAGEGLSDAGPSGVAALQRALVPLLASSGRASLSALSREDLVALEYGSAARTGLPLAGYGVLPMWTH